MQEKKNNKKKKNGQLSNFNVLLGRGKLSGCLIFMFF
jgi:hypothetical protein